MEQGQQGAERSDGWEGEGEGRSNGWPLGLQPVRVSIASSSSNHYNFLVSTTPSLTSFSSSDFDTESTRSFFPEKSTTLGSLIGIESSSQLAFMQISSMEENNSSMEEEKMRRKCTGGTSRSRAWWSLLGCGGGLRNDTLDVSSSLAHFLDKEKRGTLSQRQTRDNGIGDHAHEEHEQEQEQGQEQDERLHSDEIGSHRSNPYDNVDAIASPPCGPTLRLILQQPSPTAYLSTDWNVFSDLSQHHHIRADSSHGHGRSHTFWPGLCGRLSTNAAN